MLPGSQVKGGFLFSCYVYSAPTNVNRQSLKIIKKLEAWHKKHQLTKFNSAKRCEILPDTIRTAMIRDSGILNRGWKDWRLGKQALCQILAIKVTKILVI